MKGSVYLREVEEGDLPDLFAHQRDPVANQMAAFPAREREAFMVHWRKILADDRVMKRTIVHETEVAGNVVCFEQSGRMLLGYWLGRKFWGQGIATQAVAEFVTLVSARPLHALVAKGNVASIRVLEKCGFKVSGKNTEPDSAGGDFVEELIYSLSE